MLDTTAPESMAIFCSSYQRTNGHRKPIRRVYPSSDSVTPKESLQRSYWFVTTSSHRSKTQQRGGRNMFP